MKKRNIALYFQKFLGVISLLCVVISQMSINTHCQCLIYEPDMPEELKK